MELTHSSGWQDKKQNYGKWQLEKWEKKIGELYSMFSSE